MSDIETIGNEEQEIFDSPDSLGGSDLGQGPANPAFDGIAKQQSYADNGSEDLYMTINIQIKNKSRKTSPTQQASKVAVPGSQPVSYISRSPISRPTDVDVSFLGPRDVHDWEDARECKGRQR